MEEVVYSAITAGPPDGERVIAPQDGEIQRLRHAAWFGATLDFEALALRIMEAAFATCAADAAAVTVDRLSVPTPLIKALNLSEHELLWLSTKFEEDEENSSIISYPSRGVDTGDLETALVVPLSGRDGRPVGKLAALWRRNLAEADDRLRALEDVAAVAWSAVENARRFEELSATLDTLRDPLRRSA